MLLVMRQTVVTVLAAAGLVLGMAGSASAATPTPELGKRCFEPFVYGYDREGRLLQCQQSGAQGMKARFYWVTPL